MKFNWKGFVSLLLCLALFLGGIANGQLVHAADAENLVVYESRSDVQDYRGDINSAPTKTGYKFAGWYKEDSTKESGYAPLKAAEADNASSAYAKFVVDDVLSIKCQLTAGATLDSSQTAVRMLTSVDALDYRSVGFEIQIDETTVTRESKVVYSSINAYTKEDGVTPFTASEAFQCEASEYFMAFTITEVLESDFTKTFTFTPFWTTVDGTTVKGVPNESFTVEDVLAEDVELVTVDDFVADYGSQGGSYTFDANVSHTDDGSGSVLFLSGGRLWPAAAVNLGMTAEELAEYGSLSFWIRPVSPAGDTHARIQIGQGATNYTVGEWHQITISTNELSVDENGVVKLFNMLNDALELTLNDTYTQVYIDDMVLNEKPGIGLVTANDFVADYASQGGSFIFDTSVSHTDDGSGSVKMLCSGRIWPHAAVKLGMTAEELAEYESLSFWIMMESPSGNEAVRMYVPALDAAANYTVGEWHQITIPTSQIPIDANGVTDLFNMLNDTAGVGDPQANIYIDDMAVNRISANLEDYDPNSLTVAFYDIQNNIYGFTFNTKARPLEPVIRIKKTDEAQWTEYAMTTVQEHSYDSSSKITYYISKAEIELEENTSYTYCAYDKGVDRGTESTTLQTKSSNAETFKFAHLSDSQDGPDEFGLVLSQIADVADFMIHTGDVVETSKYEYEWEAMLDGNYKDVTRIPIMAISGNHETTYKNGSNETFKHFNHMIPQQESTTLGYFYSFIYGDVKFIMLNTNDLTSNKLKAEQYDWLVDELQNNTCKWTIVSMHHPMYSAGGYGSNSSINGVALALQEQLGGIFAQYGVDLVLQGHDHVISRSYAINASGNATRESTQIIEGVEYSVNPAGVIYLENGPAGSQTRAPYSGYDSTLYKYAQSSNKASWAEIEVDGDSLVVTVKSHDGTNENVYQKWGIIKDGTGNGGAGDDTPVVESIGLVEKSDFVANYGAMGGSYSYNANVSHTADGSGSVVMSSGGNAWPRVAVNLGLTQEALSQYDSLSFWIMAESPAGNTQSKIKVRPLGTTDYYDIGVWHQITIPTSSITLDADGVVALISTYNDALETGEDLNVKIYIDDMVLNAKQDIGLVKTEDFVANYASYGGSYSYNANVSHTADGSGSVVMSSGGNAWPRVAVNLGLTQEELSQYESLSFWFMAESPAGNAQVRVKVRPLNTITNYDVGEWYQVTIPVTSITLDADGVVALLSTLNDALETGTDLNAKIYIDDMVLE